MDFNTTNDITITDATINGGGTIANWGAGRITLSDTNDGTVGGASFNGHLLVGSGSGVSNMYYGGNIGLTSNPALNKGQLRVTSSNFWSGALQTTLSR